MFNPISFLSVIGLALFHTMLFASQNFREGHDYGKGVGLSFYLDHSAERSLVDLLLEERELFRDELRFEGNARPPFAALHQLNCHFLLWKPIEGHIQNRHNRLECRVIFKDYTKLKLTLDLGKEWIGNSAALASLPSIQSRGEVSEKIAKLLKLRSVKDLNIQKFTDSAQIESYYIGSIEEDYRPVFACKSDPINGGECELFFRQINSTQVSKDLGDTASHLIEALCGSASDLKGDCPEKNQSTSYHSCRYVGAWVQHGSWGAISRNPSLQCSYFEREKEKHLSLDLGPTLVKPWGSRFGRPGISLSGAHLEKLYEALKNYSLKNIEQNIIALGSLPAPSPWGQEWVNLKRHRDPKLPVASLICAKQGLGSDSFYQEPVSFGDQISVKYDCTIQDN